MAARLRGCYTAIVTPFTPQLEVYWEGLKSLVQFQSEQGITGIVPAGTTGESPTLTWDEHNKVIETVFREAGSKALTIAGTGSNSTDEALAATKHVHDVGIRAALLVDPYYNGPSSLEIRREYYEPIAMAVPEVQVIPYVIPGRTGAQLLPQDLAILSTRFDNVTTVKEATGSLDNARLTRQHCGPEFSILSGDDDKTLTLMRDPSIRSSGVISVISNIVPRAVSDMVSAAFREDWEEATRIGHALAPLFGLVTVKVDEVTPYGSVPVKARNPLPIKTMMSVLGMRSGPCRRPLGKVTSKGLDAVVAALRKVWEFNSEFLEPIEKTFDVSVDERLRLPRYWEGLAYDGY